MDNPLKTRKAKLAMFGLRLLCFLVILTLALWYGAYVLAPKYAYGMCPMLNLYFQPTQSVDVLALGTSLIYCGVNTYVLWQEYGISTYNLCTAEQPYWVSYYLLREALKTQTPKVILLDARPCVYQEEHSAWYRTVLHTYGILSPENRIGAILASAETWQEAVEFILGVPKVKELYDEVTAVSFVFPPDNEGRGGDWKGYIEEDDVHQYTRPSLVWSKEEGEIPPKQETYVRKIFELANQKGIPVLLIGVPNPDYKIDHLSFNSLWSIAAEYGVEGINYNMPTLRFGLNFAKDFADWEHLNVRGSITFSRKLGQDLKDRYDLPDHRGDEAYASYETGAAAWFAKLPEFQSAPEEK